MTNPRKYGISPFSVVAIHGGPGGPGQVAPIAKELSTICGILEPLQTESTLEGQVEELRTILNEHAESPVTLIGHSWGAMLSLIFVSRYPSGIKKLILVSCPPLQEKYAAQIMNIRFSRLKEEQKTEIDGLLKKLNAPETNGKNEIFAKLAHLALQIDSYDPIFHNDETIEHQYDIFSRVWKEAETFRKNGGLEETIRKIKIPVVAIHGDYDPHPDKGVEIFLSTLLQNFKFFLLEKCGHYPWIERFAKDRFYTLLKTELLNESDVKKTEDNEDLEA